MILFLLLAAHCLCDYPLQGDFLANGKNHWKPIPGVPWYQCLLAHSFIHAVAVALITGSLGFGIAELVCHFFIDHSKCAGLLGAGHAAFNVDQALHVSCKVIWALAIWRIL